MAGGWHLIAFHDTKAAPVETMTVSSSGFIAEYLTKLAEKAGLGAKVPSSFGSGIHLYENGEIHVEKEKRH